MDIIHRLNNELLKQPFSEEQRQVEQLNECRQIASVYARIENAVAVLSDMKANKSYIYYGKVAEKLGLVSHDEMQTIPSIWEKDIFCRIHPDDLTDKHAEELRFYHFVKGVPKDKRTDYYLSSSIRMRDITGKYIPILHRMFYLTYDTNGCVRLVLCLYSLTTTASLERLIVNSANGQMLELQMQNCSNLLTDREKIILQLIDQGKMSKDIAQLLSISINTVSRHRQNILEKLQVNNSIEACKVARKLNLL
ncbi:MAG: LuxR C-terminal-related transcriptional regulator [Bacteroides sp.]|nr:LuxR C-terminal-related transcriptional regulator [Bacteroides sp.]